MNETPRIARELGFRPGRTARFARRLILILFCSFAQFTVATAMFGPQEESAPNARSGERRNGLLPVPIPDLTSLDPAVSKQIKATADALDRALSEPNSGPAELAEAFATMGEIYQAYALPASAEACYLNAIRLAGKRFRWVYLLARVTEGQGRLEEAVASYESTLSMEPNNVPSLVHLGNVYLQLGKLDEASQKFREAIKLNPDSAAAHAGSGQVALKLQDYPAAVSAFTRALELAPAANRLHYLLAMAYRGTGDQEAGKAHLQQSGSVGVRVDDPIEKELENLLQGEKVHIVRGRLAYMAGQYRESIQEFREALTVSPDSCPARLNLAGALASSGNLDEALNEYEAAKRNCSDSPALHFNLGRLYSEKRQPAKALEHYQAALQLDSADLATLVAVARLSAQQGLTEQATEYFKRSVTLHPDSEEAWYEFCSFLIRGKEYAKARDRLEEACTRLPAEGRLAERLARLLAASPDLSIRNGARAFEFAHRVYEAAPTVHNAETLALALAETGHCEDAAALLKKSITVLEESQKYPELLARMRRDVQRYEQGQPCRPPG